MPSRATVPTLTIPALAHSASTCTNNSASRSACRWRNRLIVLWSGARLAAITRNATSSTQRRSIWREERSPTT